MFNKNCNTVTHFVNTEIGYIFESSKCNASLDLLKKYGIQAESELAKV